MERQGARSVRVRISGHVQGVNFRAWTERQARSLGLSGWVRNRANGDVEAVFCGPAATVQSMLEACRRGPRLAEVKDVEIVGDAEPIGGAFTIRFDL
jgi:acylphosphatase